MNAQDLINEYQDRPGEMVERLWDWWQEQEEKPDLQQPVTVQLWHGTRRKESAEELKAKGFCTFSPGEVEEFIDEANRMCKQELNAGPRVCKWMDNLARNLKQSYSGRDYEFGISNRPNLWTSYDEGRSCSWAFRNPEIVSDAFYWRTPTKAMDKILTELFGEPKKIKVRVEVSLGDLIGSPQNLNTHKQCFTPDDIIEIEECSHEDVVRAYDGRMPACKYDCGWITSY